MEKIGFIGLGIMGKPMALNLISAGCDVMVNDIDSTSVAALVNAGATKGTYSEIGANCDIIITILPNGAIVQEILFGKDGVVSGISANKVVCDMSSVSIAESLECYNKLKKLQVGFVDAPVSGGEPGAIAATLAIMCGGDERDYNRLIPFFEIMGSSHLLIGGSGSGSVTKLANQIIVNLNIAALSEALVFATKAGTDPMKVYKAIRGGLAGSVIMDAKTHMICKRDFTPGGKISVNHKDIKNALQTAHSLDIPVPFTAQLFELLQALKIKGHMDDDHCGYVQYFEELSGVIVESEETA